MYAVAGVTGHTGSKVALNLLKQGKEVRAIVRTREPVYKWRDRGAEVAVADLNDSSALSQALAGVQGAYLLTPQNVQDDHPLERWARQNQSLVDAVLKSKCPHTVFLSSMGAHQNKPSGLVHALHDAEQKFMKAGVPVTFLRAAYFYENWIPALEAVQEMGRLPTFLKPRLAVPMVSVEDVARTAVDLLLNPPEDSRIVELSGPREYSPQDVVTILEQSLGKAVSILPFKEGGWEAVWGDEELPEEMNHLLNATYDGFNKKRIVFSGKQVESREGSIMLEEVLGKWVV